MSNQRYSPEFKDEAVRQIVDRGYSVAEVSERLGVSAHSLYKWVKAIKPYKTDEQAAALVEARSEVLKGFQTKKIDQFEAWLREQGHLHEDAALSRDERLQSVLGMYDFNDHELVQDIRLCLEWLEAGARQLEVYAQ